MNNPLVAEEQDSTRWYTGIGIAESIDDLVQGIESGSWVDIGLGAATTGLEALSIVMDPIGSVASNLVSFIIEHVGPLQDMLDKLAGDADAVAAQAQTWKNIAQAVGGVQADYSREVTADTSGWTGAAGDAYRGQGTEVAALIGAGSQAASGLGSAVEMAGLVVGMVRETVRDLIADLVGRLVVWAAEALTIIGAPAAAAQAATAAAKWAARIGQLVKKLVRTMQNLMPLLRRLGDLLRQIRRRIDDLRGGRGGGDEPPDRPGRPRGDDGDPFDNLPEADRERLINDLMNEHNQRGFPLSRESAEAMLRDGPPGTRPELAGEGGAGADVRFVDENGNVVLQREVTSAGGGYSSFNSKVSHAADQLGGNGEIHAQVRNVDEVENWVRRFQSQPGRNLDDYQDVTLVVRDQAGNIVGRYDLGERLPPR